MHPFIHVVVIIVPTLTRSCTVKFYSWSNKRMCANRLSDHTNADLCTDRKSRLSHDIPCLFEHVLYIVFLLLVAMQEVFCQVALVLLIRTWTTAMLSLGKPSEPTGALSL